MIGGNTTIRLQKKTGFTQNQIGEKIPSWNTMHNIRGWLDLSNGDSKRTIYNAKIQESTHIFICDYVTLGSSISTENSRVIDEDGLVYDVMLIDDPMKLHKQLEIYLKFTGGQ